MVGIIASLRGALTAGQAFSNSAVISSLILRDSCGALLSSQREIHMSSLIASSTTTSTATTTSSSPSSTHERPQQPSTSQTTTAADFSSLLPRVMVFGGSGFVGSRVCEQAARMGADVVSVSRSGRPSWIRGAWADSVEWIKGDAFDPEGSWKDYLSGTTGVVSTLGTFGSNELMYKVCGTANMVLMDAAAEAGVNKFAFISVHDYQFPGGWNAKQFLLKGYFQGKRDAEAHLARVFPTSGVALRPGFVYGSRHTGSMMVPLGLVGAPLAAALKMVPTRSLSNIPIIGAAFVPPVSVDTVGKAAASAVLDDQVPAGVMDVWDIKKYA